MTSDARGSGFHFATIAHAGRIWDAYLEFDDDPRRPNTYRARIRFDAPGDEEEPRRTAALIIENSFEEAVDKARRFDERQLVGLLRSCLPDGDDASG